MLRIGGFIPFSLCDYPGHVAAVVFTQGCNFRCPFCHNGSLIPSDPGGGLTAQEKVFDFLATRTSRLDGIVISGGEPTIQPSLPSFLRRIKAAGYKVKLDTNGSRPVVLRALLRDRLVDYVAMDVKAPFSKYDELAGVAAPIQRLRESIALISESHIDHEFRTTYVPSMLSGRDISEIGKLLPPNSPHRLQAFRPEHAFDPVLRDTDRMLTSRADLIGSTLEEASL